MASLQETTIDGPSSGYGVAPVGTILPILKSMTGSYSIPSTGTVFHGWMLCDGAAIPAGNTLSGSVPDLTNSRFLRGNKTANAGTTGGVNSVTLSRSNMPSHTHTGNIGRYCHNHGVSDPTHQHDFRGSYTGEGGGLTFEFGYGTPQIFWAEYSGTGLGVQNRCLSHSYTTAACGSGTAITIMPKYIDVVYLIRVK